MNIRKNMNAKLCLLLGGNGFLGSHLAMSLAKKGYAVRIYDNFNTGKSNLQNIDANVEIINGDYLNLDQVEVALQGVDYLFHYISTTVPVTAANNPVYDIQTNLVNSVKIFQIAIKNNIKRVIFPSSGGTVYGEPVSIPVKESDALNPQDPYGISKMAIETYLKYFNRISGLDYLILRYSNPYGERQNPQNPQGVIPVFLNQIKHGESPMIYGDGSMARDYIYVGDAIEATVAAFEAKTEHKVFNVGSGKSTSLNDLVRMISNVVGKKIIPIYLPDNIVRVQKTMLDITLIRDQVGWVPTTDLKTGIEFTWKWMNSF
jgi:UDP-glucose 4-epimerase